MLSFWSSRYVKRKLNFLFCGRKKNNEKNPQKTMVFVVSASQVQSTDNYRYELKTLFVNCPIEITAKSFDKGVHVVLFLLTRTSMKNMLKNDGI